MQVLEKILDRYSEVMLQERSFQCADTFECQKNLYALNVAYRDNVFMVVLSAAVPGQPDMEKLRKEVEGRNQTEIQGFFSVSQEDMETSVTYHQRVGILQGIPERNMLEKILDTGIAKIENLLLDWGKAKWQETMNLKEI